MPKFYNNSYSKRRNSYSSGYSGYSIQTANQLASQIARSLTGFQTGSFFQEGGEVLGRVLSNPKELTSLHTHQEVIVEKEEAVARVSEENIRSRPGRTEGKSGGYSERRKTQSIFEKVAASRCRFFSKKGSDANIYRQKPCGELFGERTFNSRNSTATKRKRK
jgi:hypothetical protein